MEWLKEILGDGATDEVMEKVKQEFPKHAVPKDQYNKKATKLDEVESELTTAKEQLESTNDTIEGLKNKASNYDDLKGDFEQLQTDYNEYKEGENTRLAKVKKKSALEKDLLKSEANQDAVDLLINDFNIDEMELDEDGSIKEFDSHLKKVKEKRPKLFPKQKTETDEPAIDVDSMTSITNEQADELDDKTFFKAKQEGKL